MSPTDGPASGHLGMEELADDQAGLLPAPRSAEIADHLASCPTCAADAARLDQVTVALRSAPHPAMPAEVGDRIDAALLSERGSAPTVIPLDPSRPARSRRMTWAGAAAIAAVIALVGVVLASHFTAGSSTGGAGESASSAGGPIPVASIDPQSLQAVVTASGTHYTKADIESQVADNVSGKHTATSATSERASTEDNGPMAKASPSGGSSGRVRAAAVPTALTPLQNPSVLSRCVAQLLAGSLLQPLYVDLAHFDGKPAVVVVVPENDKSDLAYVADASCGQPNFSGTILAYTEVPRS